MPADAVDGQTGDDPELFATYLVLAGENVDAVAGHIAELTAQLTRIVAAGITEGVFAPGDPASTGRTLFHLSGRYHDPCYAREWERPDADRDFEAAVDLLLRGLRVR
ncbi:hypothetical protein AB0F77_31940 [Streptomyces sp. NPDC026672]|uniref:hypothetical protein n=1 Tax=unclassified Streptomyces TaxID=2593676 RepID=UPI00340090FE